MIPSSAPTRGVLAVFGAFGIWGALPLYLRELSGVPAGQIVAYRLVFCCAFVLLWLGLRGAVGQVRSALAARSTRRRLVLSATFISINWLVYVWAVGNGRVGAYGLLRKTIAVEAMAGLGAETLLFAPFGVAYMAWSELNGSGVLGHADGRVVALLVLSGPVTAVPLWLFAYGARQVAYSTVGLLQYLGPSLQLAIGVLVFAEPFPRARAAGFALIWAALALYAAEGLWRARALART